MNYNRAINQGMNNQNLNRQPRPQNPRFVLVNQNNQGNAMPINNNNTNQNSVTQKLCKFFINLLDLERVQGRYEMSVSIIQKYINKEITIEELGSQLKGNTNKTELPETLMNSLNSNIDDLRREMFSGRVRIEGIQPPPESVIVSGPGGLNGSGVIPATPTNVSAALNSAAAINAVNLRLANSTQAVAAAAAAAGVSTINSGLPRTMSFTQVTAPSIRPNQLVRQPLINPGIGTVRQMRPSVIASSCGTNPISQQQQQQQATITAPNTIQVRPPPIKQEETMQQQHESPQKMQEQVATSAATGTTNTPSSNTSNNNSFLNVTNFRAQIWEKMGCTATDEGVAYLSEAMEHFCRNLLEQVALVTCHRCEVFAGDPNYRRLDDVRSQMQFLQQLDAEQRLSEEERQKQELIKASKSRSRVDSQEQQRIKEKVRKMQEFDKNCEEYSRANQTALKAIGVTKRKWIDGADDEGGSGNPSKLARISSQPLSASQTLLSTGFLPGASRPLVNNAGVSVASMPVQIQTGVNSSPLNQAATATASNKMPPPSSTTAARYRTKRIILKDFQLVLEKNHQLTRFKTYRKIFSYGRY